MLLIWSEVVQLQLFVFSGLSAAFFKIKVIAMHEAADLTAKRVDFLFFLCFFFKHANHSNYLSSQILRMYTGKCDRLSGGC